MKTAKTNNALAGSTADAYSFTPGPPAKTCRHRQRSSSGRCLDCGFHREPASVQGEALPPSTVLSIRL